MRHWNKNLELRWSSFLKLRSIWDTVSLEMNVKLTEASRLIFERRVVVSIDDIVCRSVFVSSVFLSVVYFCNGRTCFSQWLPFFFCCFTFSCLQLEDIGKAAAWELDVEFAWLEILGDSAQTMYSFRLFEYLQKK